MKGSTPIWTNGLSEWVALNVVPQAIDNMEAINSSPGNSSALSQNNKIPPKWNLEEYVYFSPVALWRYIVGSTLSCGLYATFWRNECMNWYTSGTIAPLPPAGTGYTLLSTVKDFADKQNIQSYNLTACRMLYIVSIVLFILLAIILFPNIGIGALLIPSLGEAIGLLPAVIVVKRLNKNNLFAETKARQLSMKESFPLLYCAAILLIVLIVIVPD